MSKKIKVVTTKDMELFKSIYRCGFVSKDIAYSTNWLPNRSRINSLLDSKYLKKYATTDKKGRSVTYYRLTRKGVDYVKDNTNVQKHYNFRSVHHDRKLLQIYTSLNKFERESWATELDVINEYRDVVNDYVTNYMIKNDVINKDKEIPVSAVDATYMKMDGSCIAVEVVTSNYKDVHITAKENYANAIGMKLVMCNA